MLSKIRSVLRLAKARIPFTTHRTLRLLIQYSGTNRTVFEHLMLITIHSKTCITRRYDEKTARQKCI